MCVRACVCVCVRACVCVRTYIHICINVAQVPIVTPNGDVLIEELSFAVQPGLHCLVTGARCICSGTVAHPCHICTGTGLTPPTSTRVLHRDCTRPFPTSAPGLGSTLVYRRLCTGACVPACLRPSNGVLLFCVFVRHRAERLWQVVALPDPRRTLAACRRRAHSHAHSHARTLSHTRTATYTHARSLARTHVHTQAHSRTRAHTCPHERGHDLNKPGLCKQRLRATCACESK
jgi:hypothetical protein